MSDKVSRRGAFFAIYFVIFMDNFGFAMIFALLSPLILDPSYGFFTADVSLGVKNFLLAALFGAFSLTQFLGAPILGDIADHFGRRKTFYISIIGTTLGFIFSALSIAIGSVIFFAFSRLFTGAFAGNNSICLAAIADMSPDEKQRGKNFGYVTVVYGASWILSMLTGGVFANPKFFGPSGPQISFWIVSCLSILNLGAILLWYRDSIPLQSGYHFTFSKGFMQIKEAFLTNGLRRYFSVYILWVIGWGYSVQWLTPFLYQIYHVSPLYSTIWLIMLGITWSIGGSVVNKAVLERVSSLKAATYGMLIISLMVFVAIFMSEFFFGLMISLAATFAAVAMSNILNLISTIADASVQGKVMGLSQSVICLGWVIVSIVAAIISAISLEIIYPFTALALFIGFIILVTSKNKGIVEN